MRILIVKTSSLGDIIQTMPVLDLLHQLSPGCEIDWAVEPRFQDALVGHPLLSRVINWRERQELRREQYDVLFDLQGNCKSGLATLLARAKVKVGYGLQSVREWPNVFATNVRFNISKQQNIRAFYLELIARYFGAKAVVPALEKKPVALGKVMVCFGSRQPNKQLSEGALLSFLQKLEGERYFLMWGSVEEREQCLRLQAQLGNGEIVERLSVPAWRAKMEEMDLVIAVDSAALHLCATTTTPSFSIFGPTKAEVFAPRESLVFQAACPYGQTFDKQCVRLRSCPTGACMKNITGAELFDTFKSQVELKSNKE